MKHNVHKKQSGGPAFVSKAQTLELLSTKIKNAKVLPLEYFTVDAWASSPEKILAVLGNRDWLSIPLVVRSSALNEDNTHASNAGHFTSVLNVSGDAALKSAIHKVIVSYDSADPLHEILIQPMLENVTASGVAFTHDPNSGGPYIVINYDETTGSTQSVTSGSTNTLTSYYYHRLSPQKPGGLLGKVIALCEELEQVLGVEALDIEFALCDGELYLLQARTLVMAAAKPANAKAHAEIISHVAKKIAAGMRPHPYLYGKQTVYGVMPDWNPAEIIGIRPKPLALSLYRELITDSIWAYQRDNYGYFNLRGFPLLHDFAGLPYIDVRVSFNSFVPKSLPTPLARKLLDYYLDRLIAQPQLHDKVEFAIVFSCYTFDLRARLKTLLEHGFSSEDCEDIANSLTSLTNSIVDKNSGLWKKDIGKIETLEHRQQLLGACGLEPASHLYWLIEDCKRYGTLPFAGLARAGFIAVQMLRSMVTTGIIDEAEYAAFIASVDSVSSSMGRDFDTLEKNAFLKKYGHLRPGTYDILSARYDETPERYFDWSERKSVGTDHKESSFALSVPKMRELQNHIDRDGLKLDVLQLLEFIKTAIEAREYSKFVFTRSLSDFLQHLEQYGKALGFSREDLAYANVGDVLALYSGGHAPKEVLARSIESGRQTYVATRSLSLPALITSPKDVWAFFMPASLPNFITQKCTEGHVATINAGEHGDLTDAIVCIPSADPGYDWIFAHGIRGLITTYGGVNSHMAIRAGELQIPAIIGAGELLFSQWVKAKKLFIDCANKQVRILQS